MKKLLNQRAELLHTLGLVNELKLDDLYALHLISPLMNHYPVLPFTGASLGPFGLALIINDVLVNKRTSIIEFGSGISTVILGRLIKKNKLNTNIISIDHDEKWIKMIRTRMRQENLNATNIELVHAPLKPTRLV